MERSTWGSGHNGVSVRWGFSARRRRVGVIPGRSNGIEPYLVARGVHGGDSDAPAGM